MFGATLNLAQAINVCCYCAFCSVDAVTEVNVVETDHVEVLQLMNTSATDSLGIDQVDTSLASASPAAVAQTSEIFLPCHVCICFAVKHCYA